MWHTLVETEMCIGFLWENLNERDCLEDLDIDRRVILKSILHNGMGRCEINPAAIEQGTSNV
jgi:hypothetical protein